ncbi:hypothetical protein HHK36_004061 [Tetracentron sinense]|uniref:STAS domain-containing protein n=1 Tax=Tetracentron sinense TaxID=13715 RepID=A0A834ZPE0_TETSI|nr:hypothetical protein HHK36_004061 [Tetracentron sinense]
MALLTDDNQQIMEMKTTSLPSPREKLAYVHKGIGYAKLANLDPETVTDSSIVPPLIYAFMGSSREIVIGPVAMASLFLGTLLQSEIDPVKQASQYRRLAFTATFFAGITQFTLGFLRLGILGIKEFTKRTDIVSIMQSVWGSIHHVQLQVAKLYIRFILQWNLPTISIGATFLALLLLAKHIGKKDKKFFWVPAIAPLISVILSTLFVYITHVEKDGVQIVSIMIGMATGLIALTEAIAIGTTFASMKDYQLDGNKEMVALGAMNVVGSMTSCYVVNGSFSRSSVNCMAGCHTAVVNIVMSCIIFLTLEFITPLLKYTPNAILSSIIISNVIGLIDFEAAILIWKIDKFDFLVCMGVVFSSVYIALLIAFSMSIAKILLQVTRPHTAIFGKLPGTTIYRDIQQYTEATKVPGILIVRVDSAIYFSNSNYIKERILRWLTDEEEQIKAKDQPQITFLIFNMSPVNNIDSSGIHALEKLYRNLQKIDVQLVLANPVQVLMDKFHASKFTDMIGEDQIFLTVADAVLTFSPKMVEP